ncbi:MAG: glutathione S-transferase family protein [Elstera sp.]
MSALELIGLPQSNFVLAVRFMLEEKELAYTLTPAPPHSPAVVAGHPLGKIPVLRHGAVLLGESLAIARYLDRVFPAHPLVPADPVAAARVEQWASIIVTAVEPALIRTYLFAYLFPGTPDGAPDRDRITAALPATQRMISLLETAVRDGQIGAAGFALPDAYLAPILFYLQGLPESGQMVSNSPHLSAYAARLFERASGKALLPPPPMPA